jgi:hypothetical protein
MTLTPLEMARHCARNVQAIADASKDRDPVERYIARVGEQQFHHAQLGACMALISIAGDLHAIAEQLGADGASPRADSATRDASGPPAPAPGPAGPGA